MTLRQRLAEILSQRGYGAQSDLARALDVHRNTVNNWVHGKVDIPPDEVPRIAAALGVRICELYGVDDRHSAEDLYADLAGGGAERMLAELRQWLAGQLRARGAGPAKEPFQPTPGMVALRSIYQQWPTLSAEEQEEWLRLADDLRDQQQPHARDRDHEVERES